MRARGMGWLCPAWPVVLAALLAGCAEGQKASPLKRAGPGAARPAEQAKPGPGEQAK